VKRTRESDEEGKKVNIASHHRKREGGREDSLSPLLRREGKDSEKESEGEDRTKEALWESLWREEEEWKKIIKPWPLSLNKKKKKRGKGGAHLSEEERGVERKGKERNLPIRPFGIEKITFSKERIIFQIKGGLRKSRRGDRLS